MLSRRDEILIGLGVMAMAAALLFLIIPDHIAMPRRVRLPALAPDFWPRIIGWTMLAAGAGLVVKAAMAPVTPDRIVDSLAVSGSEALRMLGLAVTLVIAYVAIPVVGMVWVSMVVFVVLVLMSGGLQHGWSRVVWAVATAVLLPLILYLFFYKVAGVAIPQGRFVRLP